MIYTCQEEDIRRAIPASGVAIHSDWAGGGIAKVGRGLSFRLALDTSGARIAEGKTEDGKPHPWLYQRASASAFQNRRRVAAVCWHGHYAAMRYLLAVCPDARIKTSWADYRGLTEFLRDAPATGWKNIGSMMYPCQADEACFCADYGRDDIGAIDYAADEWSSLVEVY